MIVKVKTFAKKILSICFFFKGLLNQHILNNISQINASSSNTSSTITLANGTTIPSSLYSGPGTTTLPNSNIPLEISSTTSNSLDPLMNSQQSPLLSRTISETTTPPLQPSTTLTDRSIINSSLPLATSSLMTNGSLDSGHTSLETNTNNTFLSNDILPTNTSGIIGQLPDHHSFRYLLPLSNQQQTSIQTNRVPLTPAETRMLNRLNSAYTKLPSLLESERQR